jgi:hypothetical protein
MVKREKVGCGDYIKKVGACGKLPNRKGVAMPRPLKVDV